VPDVSPESRDTPDPAEPRITWWRPGWQDVVGEISTARLMLISAAVVLLVLLAIGVGVLGWPIWFAGGLKLLGLLIAAAVSLIGCAIRRAVQARKEPFCIFCGYNLTGLPDGYRCPECGRAYTWAQIEEYRRDPQWFIERWNARQCLPAPDTKVEIRPDQPRRRSRDGT
jgi:hypothetical protein